MTRYIFICGGVISGVGKGVATASIGAILKSKGFKVSAMKIDPYLNVDAGTMNPIEHGEVFVTEDGEETDQDVGHYERFLDNNIYAVNYMTSGKVYLSVIEKERNLEYDGKCVETIPHIPNEVIRRIKAAERKTKADFLLIEIGGTVGEYQNNVFFEAARRLKLKYPEKVLFVLVTYLPIPSKLGEMKTKPTQMAIRTLNSLGVQPDIVLARSQLPLDRPRKRKISVSGNIDIKDVISAPDVESIYEVPLNFEKEKIGERILKKFGLKNRPSRFKEWERLVKVIETAKKSLKIGIVGKYFQTGKFVLADSYISVIEAIKHSVWHFGFKPEIKWLNAEEYEKNSSALKELEVFSAVIVPGGFGKRGVEGKILAIKYVREHKIPFLGLCYGLQLATIEIARHLAGLKKAHTTEVDSHTPFPVIDILPDQREKIEKKDYGGTMRLGAYKCQLNQNSLAYRAYKKRTVYERHRHRYEVNNKFLPQLKKAGLKVAGKNPERNLVEIIEFKDHPYFVATQFHPEFKSRPLRPHPLFRELIRQAIKRAGI
ncbi:CTP synthase [bacterium]|nr:CTP synthase [bacterium]